MIGHSTSVMGLILGFGIYSIAPVESGLKTLGAPAAGGGAPLAPAPAGNGNKEQRFND